MLNKVRYDQRHNTEFEVPRTPGQNTAEQISALSKWCTQMFDPKDWDISVYYGGFDQDHELYVFSTKTAKQTRQVKLYADLIGMVRNDYVVPIR